MNTIRKDGKFTIPAEFRKKYGMDEGKFVTLIDMGNGSFILSSKVGKVDRLANNIARQFKEDNVTLEDMLETLDEERERLYKEHYSNE